MINKYADWLRVKELYKNIYPDGHLNIEGYRNGLLSEGEGINFEIFTQGCMRFCRGCRNVGSAKMVLMKLIAIEQLVKIVKKNIKFPVNPAEKVTDPEHFLENIFLLYLEKNLMDQQQTKLYDSPFTDIPYPLFMNAWYVKYSLLNRLAFSLMNREITFKGKGRMEIAITGITLCGGEPLYQAKNILNFVVELRKQCSLEIWIMTGFLFEDISRYKEIKKLLSGIDYLIDGAFIKKKENYAHPMMGSTNQRVIDVQKTLLQKKMVLWSPRYSWTKLFNPYWKTFMDRENVGKYHPFQSSDEVLFHLKNNEMINHISTTRDYEKTFGDIRKNFIGRILE